MCCSSAKVMPASTVTVRSAAAWSMSRRKPRVLRTKSTGSTEWAQPHLLPCPSGSTFRPWQSFKIPANSETVDGVWIGKGSPGSDSKVASEWGEDIGESEAEIKQKQRLERKPVQTSRIAGLSHPTSVYSQQKSQLGEMTLNQSQPSMWYRPYTGLPKISEPKLCLAAAHPGRS